MDKIIGYTIKLTPQMTEFPNKTHMSLYNWVQSLGYHLFECHRGRPPYLIFTVLVPDLHPTVTKMEQTREVVLNYLKTMFAEDITAEMSDCISTEHQDSLLHWNIWTPNNPVFIQEELERAEVQRQQQELEQQQRELERQRREEEEKPYRLSKEEDQLETKQLKKQIMQSLW